MNFDRPAEWQMITANKFSAAYEKDRVPGFVLFKFSLLCFLFPPGSFFFLSYSIQYFAIVHVILFVFSLSFFSLGHLYFSSPLSECVRSLSLMVHRIGMGRAERAPAIRPPLHPPRLVPYQLRAHIYQGKNVPAADSTGTSDPYVVVVFGSQARKTAVRKVTCFPLWSAFSIPPLNFSFVPHPIYHFLIPDILPFWFFFVIVCVLDFFSWQMWNLFGSICEGKTCFVLVLLELSRYQTLILDVEIPAELNLAPRIVVQVWDRDEGIFDPDDFLGRFEVAPEELKKRWPGNPKWYVFSSFSFSG